MRDATQRGIDALVADHVNCEYRQVEAGAKAAIEAMRPVMETLEYLADLHHRTLTNSELHDPERINDFRDCPCLSCQRVTGVIAQSTVPGSSQ